jgi:hypothetical protein
MCVVVAKGYDHRKIVFDQTCAIHLFSIGVLPGTSGFISLAALAARKCSGL